METSGPPNPTIERLEDQIAWYGKRSQQNRAWYKWLKGVTIVSALLIAPVSTMTDGRYIAAGLGIAIAIAEGLQQLNQFQANWISYRSTSEALKHEKYLYLGQAGPYAAVERPLSLLAERIGTVTGKENSTWISTQERAGRTNQQPSQT